MNAEERAQFLEERRTGIGSSDIAAIAGVSPWKSAVEVYADKVGAVLPDEPTDRMMRGTLLEPVVLEAYRIKSGMEYVQRADVARHPEKPWALAHPDAYAIEGLIEAKTADNDSDWNGAPPEYYNLQCQWQMGVVGATRTVVPVIFAYQNTFDMLRAMLDVCPASDVARIAVATCDVRIYEVKRDDELIDALFQTGEEFWTEHVMKRVPPLVRTPADAKLLYPVAEFGTTIEADDETYGLVLSMPGLKRELEQAQRNLDGCQAAIQAYMGTADTLTIGGKKCASWKQQSRKGFDGKAFAAAHPDLAAKFEKSSSFRVFRMSGEKE